MILVLGAVLAGLGYGAAKLYRSTQDGPCGGAPAVAATDVAGSRGARPVTGRELTGVRGGQPPSVSRDFLPASSADVGRGAAKVRVTVLVSQDAAIEGDAFARLYALTDGNSAPQAVGTGTGRFGAGAGSAVAAGALDRCTGVVVAGASSGAVERAAAALRAP